MERIEDFKLIREFQRGFLYINSCLASLLLARIRGPWRLRAEQIDVLFTYLLTIFMKDPVTNHLDYGM